MRKKLHVAEVNCEGTIYWQVQALYRDCPDSFWEVIGHNALFRSRERAENFLARMLRSVSPQGDGWYWGVPPDCKASASCAIQGHPPFFSVL